MADYRLSRREIEYLESPKAFGKKHGRDYAYVIKNRITKKYREMKATIEFIESHIDPKTLQKLLHPKSPD